MSLTQKHRQTILTAAVASVAASLALTPTVVRAVPPVIDGTLDAVYGTAFSLQTVQTGFGDNSSELDAGYSYIENGKLHLFLSGNIESNFNKMVLFFDTRAGGQNVMRADNPNVDFDQLNTRYQGMTFDTGFSPDYAMWYSGDATTMFLNFSELNTNGGGSGGFLGSVALPNANRQGSGTVGGTGGLPTVEFGYNDSNTAGIGGDGSSAADQTAAALVNTGSELSIDLVALGATENFSLMVGINGQAHDFWSNQFLPGLTAPQINLGSDGLGNFIPPGSVSAVNFNSIAGNQFLTINYHAPLSQWNAAGDGTWTEVVKWSGDGVPNAPDARAVLGTLAGSAARQITLDTNVQLQSITFDSPGSYTILPSGGNTLTIAGNPATPSVVVNQGNHTIAAPLVLGATTNFGIAAGSTLDVTGDMTATGQTVVKTGDGVAQFKNIRAEGLFVSTGTARIAPNGTDAGRSELNSLGIEGGTTPTAKFDITNNAVVVNYPAPAAGGPEAEPYDTIKAQIVSAYNGGGANAWTGNGITSSSANATNFGIGFAEASSLATIPAIFGTPDSDAVLVRYTRYGDADLNGAVNSDDFNVLATNFGTTGHDWSGGNFNYDGLGTVNSDDFNLLATSFGLSATGPNGEVTPQDWANLAAAVPEPSSALLLAGLATSVASFRRRRAR